MKRVYTQNIDGLYQKTGLNSEKIVEFHGSVIDRNVVLYGEEIHKKVIDFDNDIDLIIVMGTSLQTAPFCALPNLVIKNFCRVLVDLEPSNCVSNMFHEKHQVSYTKFGKRRVTLIQEWYDRKKYPVQFIFQQDTDIFSKMLMEMIVK